MQKISEWKKIKTRSMVECDNCKAVICWGKINGEKYDEYWQKGRKRLCPDCYQKYIADRKEAKEMRINDMVKEAHETAKSKGWWDEEKSFGEVIALMHSELSEALEEARAGKDFNVTYYECKNPQACPDNQCVSGACCSDRPNKCKFAKPCGIPSELADCVIRIFDACGRYGIDLEQAIRVKMEYNKNRPYKHGKKF